MITLYDYEMSVDCYKVRTVLTLLDLSFEAYAIEEYPSEDSVKRPAVAVLDHDCDPPAVLHDPVAALFYLCHRYDHNASLLDDGSDPSRRAEILDWVLWSQNLSASAGAARRHESFGELIDVERARIEAHDYLEYLDRYLWFGEQENKDFLVRDFSLADIACFGDIALSEEGGVDRLDYPAVRRWCDRVKRMPNVPLMPGIFPVGAARST